MALNVSESIKMVQELWRQDTSATLTKDVAQRYFSNAVVHVETIDYRQNNTYTIVNDDIAFTTVPSDISYLLYVYKTLDMLARAVLSDDVNDSKLGISWRSGMDSISTSTAGKIKQGLFKEFSSQYKSTLISAKLASHTPERTSLYGTFNTK